MVANINVATMVLIHNFNSKFFNLNWLNTIYQMKPTNGDQLTILYISKVTNPIHFIQGPITLTMRPPSNGLTGNRLKQLNAKPMKPNTSQLLLIPGMKPITMKQAAPSDPSTGPAMLV